MPRSEGYKRWGTKARQPDTYTKVTYNGHLPDEWLSRTEFIQLAGKKFADRQFAILVPAHQIARRNAGTQLQSNRLRNKTSRLLYGCFQIATASIRTVKQAMIWIKTEFAAVVKGKRSTLPLSQIQMQSSDWSRSRLLIWCSWSIFSFSVLVQCSHPVFSSSVLIQCSHSVFPPNVVIYLLLVTPKL
jgi:hypothetical protein